MRRAVPLLLVALVAAAAAPATATAHATLESTTPERGAQLDAAPRAVVLRFSEDVEASFGAVRVFDRSGGRVEAGTQTRGRVVTARLRPGLPPGGYTVTYRVISADSHPVSGGLVFTVGSGAAPAATVQELLARGGRSGPVTATALAAARAVQFGAIALGLGCLAFLLACWLPAVREAAGASPGWADATVAFAARVRLLLLLAASAGVLSAAAAIALQGAVGGGTALWPALDATVLGDVLSTRFGTVWALGLLLWVAVGAATLVAPARVPVLRPASVGATGLALPARPSLLALGLPLVLLAALPALGGHASVQSPRGLLFAANVVHVAAMSAWVGGVVVLVVAVRAATARLEPAARTRLLAATVGRFSALAGVAVALVLVSGVAQSVVSVASFAHLLDTAYGRAVSVKLVLFAGLAGLGWVNRRRLLPALRSAAADERNPGRAGALLRRTLRIEVAVFAVVLGVTGALASYPPSTAESSGPFSGAADIGPARLDATVEPAQAGANEIHLYLFSRADGRQFDATKELRVTAALPAKGIASVRLTPRRAGPGHYVVGDAALSPAGDWRLAVTSRVSDFDEYTATLEVPIR